VAPFILLAEEASAIVVNISEYRSPTTYL
jgi:hypothetical protein